ncbi:Uncharacterized protein BP5553_02508 [Venustampulla echinocandica]|uniref:Metallo-beta-lactamase domain-containing protein n=1 Tax=Venustampulla echinocandica TaxID=2656787 RepID=A0A370U429_9HELO|nr:Uncharacterized protein BP5553_02508 [Venustampulla echinocandica]RDL42529.1 Uncharacterized protein BP5553_02508 [Venustampulla echinocandica]
MDASPSTSFISRRINSSTFVIIEDDEYGEQPYIYVKCYPKHLVITDTGCNCARSPKRSIISLQQYIETFPLSNEGNSILNPKGEKKYIIICSHCHYDHILGISQFLPTEPIIIASEFDKSFILDDLPRNSLCKYNNIPTPEYTISHWAKHMEYFTLPGFSFRIQFLHIPGHTPDSLAWYDIDENHLYVGDTFYERKRLTPIPELPDDENQDPGFLAAPGAIIFPEEGGDWIQYMSSLDLLLSFVLHQNAQLRRGAGFAHTPIPRVKAGCGHLTYDADAEHMILEVRTLFERIIAGTVSVTGSGEVRGVVHDYWLENEEARFSVRAPRRLVEEAREHFHVKGEKD